MTTCPRGVAILGATGSIGTQALSVIRDLRRGGHPIEVVALAAGRNVEALGALVREFRVRRVAVAGPGEARSLRAQLPPNTEIAYGEDGLISVASMSEADVVLNAVVGAIGLRPTLAALEAGKTVALANKESLVIAGELVLQARQRPDQIIPVDSEHAALAQLLGGLRRSELDRVWITASGGPLRDRSPSELGAVTPAEALAHPVWRMGNRISVDSATLANKAFEVIEAHHLFSLSWEQIGILIHPQACVHALAELVDGTVLAQLSPPDMRIPLRAALTYPARCPPAPARLSFAELDLSFAALRPGRYLAFDAVLEAGKQGGTAPAVANAADEVLVAAFLRGEIPFPLIGEGIATVVGDHRSVPVRDVDDVLAADNWARDRAGQVVAKRRPAV